MWGLAYLVVTPPKEAAMSRFSRRSALGVALAVGGALVTMLVVPAKATATDEGALVGTFYVYCEKCKQVDKVEDITHEHTCKNDKCKTKTVDKGTAYVVCPKGHWRDNKVEGLTKQHLCGKKVGGAICGKQMLFGRIICLPTANGEVDFVYDVFVNSFYAFMFIRPKGERIVSRTDIIIQ